MRNFNMSGPFEWRASDGRGQESEKGDEGSSESSSLLTESQSENTTNKRDDTNEVIVGQTMR